MQTIVPGGLGPTSSPALGRTSSMLGVLVVFFLFCMSTTAPALDGDSAVLQGRIDAAAQMLKSEPMFQGLSDAQRRDTIRFVVGNLLFVLLHEIGHVQITEMGLPVLGREEDAADGYATIMMLAMKNEFSERVLMEAAKGWFYSDRRDRMEHAPLVFFDSHSLDRQRAYQIVCYMVGSDPEKFAPLAEETGLPEDRQGSCQGDFSNAEWSWNKVLQDHRRTTQPRTDIGVRYGEPTARFTVFARIMKNIQLLETIAQRLSDKYVWRAPFVIEVTTCGSPGAHWNLATHTLTLCYEMAEDFAVLYSSYGSEMAVSRR
jgi:hypothetical protein